MPNLQQFLLSFLGAVLFSLAATDYIRRLALEKKLYSTVRERDVHKQPVPRLGGLAIVAAFFGVLVLLLLVAPSRLSFVDEQILGIDRNFFGVLLGALVIIGTMIYDDLKGLRWPWKLLAQIAAAVLVASFGITVHWFSNPTGSLVLLGGDVLHVGNFVITWGQVFVVIWIVAIMNIVNWLDGIDGLAGGLAVIASVTLFILAINPAISQPATALLAIILAGSVLGFLPYNIFGGRIFLGDTGSMFIGYMLAVLAIISGGKVATVSLVLGVPILDSLWVIINRLYHHRSPFYPDQTHLHHRLLKAGLSSRQTLLVFYSLSIAFGYLALRYGTLGKFVAGMWLVGVVALMIISLVVLEWKQRIKSIKK